MKNNLFKLTPRKIAKLSGYMSWEWRRLYRAEWVAAYEAGKDETDDG